MAKKTCPHCGALVESNRIICPNCRADIREKSQMKLYLIVAGIIGVIILIVAVILLLPAPQPTPLTAPQVTVPPTAPLNAAAPSCTIAITGKKNPPATIQLQVMTTTCFTGDITELSVSVNGEKKGTLNASPGSSGTFTGTSGSNNVIVVAKFANGAESVVYQNAAL